MSPKATKKRILLDFFQAREKKRVEAADLRTAHEELRRQLGSTDRTSLGYIASILREAGYEVQYEDRYSDPIMPEPYATRLKGVLEFHDLASAEQSERVALGRYKEGVGTIIDLLTAQDALAGARAQEIQARSSFYVALAQLAHDTGAAAQNLDQAIEITKEGGTP